MNTIDFSWFFSNTSTPMAIADENGILLSVNQAFCDFMGYSKSEMVDQHWSMITHPDDTRLSQNSIDIIISDARNGSTYEIEKRYIRKTGEMIWAHLSIIFYEKDDKKRLISFFHNIGDKKKLEEEITNQRVRRDLALLAAKTGIWEWNLETGMLHWDFISANIWGLASATGGDEVLLVDDAFKLIHDEDRQKMREACQHVLDTGNDLHFNDFRIHRQNDGNVRYLHSTGSVHRNMEGEIDKVIGTNSDITEIVEAKLALEKSNAELKEFAYVASHDLQEPLRTMTNYLQLLEMKLGNDLEPKTQKYIDFATSAAKKMKRLIDDLLNYSRITSQDDVMECVNLSEVIVEVLEIMELSIQESGAVIEIDNNLPNIIGLRNQLIQLFQNLLQNAIKYRKNDQVPRIKISATRGVEFYHISVSDNGIGINSKYHSKIFKVFQRLHSRGQYNKSTGIGLAVCKKILERHGGEIWVESEEGDGSTFRFTFPLKQCNRE